MTYRITGLDPAPFAPLFDLDNDALAKRGIVRVTADATPGYPCRVTLDDAAAGEVLLLLNHCSHDRHTPYRASHAIFVSEAADAGSFTDEVPPALARRTLSIRAFDDSGMMTDAALAAPGEADAVIAGCWPMLPSTISMRTMRAVVASRRESTAAKAPA